jgi:hypothetical protein
MVHGDDFLFVWTMSHASSGSVYLLKDDLSGNRAVTFETFANYFKPLTALNKVYWLSMNSAENLQIKLQQDNAVIVSSTSSYTGWDKSYRADNKIVESTFWTETKEEEYINGNYYYHGEVNFHLYSSTVGKRPDFAEYYYIEHPSETEYDHFALADLNSDKQITVLESYRWLCPTYNTTRVSSPNELCKEIPRFYNPNDKGNWISLEYPLLFGFDGECPFPVSGVIGIPSNFIYWDLPVSQFSDVTFFDTGAENPVFDGEITFLEGTVAKGESLNFPLNLNGSLTLTGSTLKDLEINMSPSSSIISQNGTISNCILNLNGTNNIPLSGYSVLTLSDCIVNGDFILPSNSTIRISGDVRLTSGSNFTAFANSNLRIGLNGRLIIENGAVCSLADMTVISSAFGKIVEEAGGNFSATNCEFLPDYESPEPDKSYAQWGGIEAGPGSIVSITNSDFTGAETAITGAPESITLTGCTFTDCDNGISLVNCNSYDISRNT